MAKLNIVDENKDAREHELTDEVTTVGRSSSNSIKITDGKSSRQHFRVEKDGEHFKVVDLGSTNGTRLNGKKVSSEILSKGDVIKVGKTTFTYDGPGPERTNRPVVIDDDDDDDDDDDSVGATIELDEDEIDKLAEVAAKKEDDEPKHMLKVLEGSNAGEEHDLGIKTFTIGRHKTNALSISDDAASNYHCEISKEPIGYVIADLGSTNGTKVKAKDADTFEKIVKTPLANGMQIRIGKTVIEYRNLGASSEDDGIFGTVVLDGEGLSNQIAERPAAASAGLPKGVITALTALAAVVFFGGVVALVMALVPGDRTDEDGQAKKDTPPVVEQPTVSDIVENGDFSAGVDDFGNPIGWMPTLEPGVRKVKVDETAQAPSNVGANPKGLIVYKNGAKSPSTLSSVENRSHIPVDPAQVYEVSGEMSNEGEGLLGLSVTWKKGDQKSLTEYPVVLVSNQDWKKRSAVVRPPTWADKVVVGVFSIGREGKSHFDNITFAAKPGAEVPPTPTVRFGRVNVDFEGSKGAFAAGVEGVPVLQQGSLALVGKGGNVVSDLSSAIQPQVTEENARTTYRGLLYDFLIQNPTGYRIDAQEGAGGVSLRFAVDPQSGGSTPRVNFYVVGEQARGDIEYRVGNKTERLGATANKDLRNVTEILFNVGKQPQLYLNFSKPVTINTRRTGDRRLVEFSFDTELSMDIAPENVGEKQILTRKLRDLDEALRRKEWAMVYRTAQEIDAKYRSKFPEAKEKVDAAYGEFDDAFEVVKKEIDNQVDLMKRFKTGDPVKKKLEDLLPPWAGTPKEQAFKDALTLIAELEKQNRLANKEDEAASKLAKAQAAYDKKIYIIAVSYCNQVIRDFPKSEAAKQAEDLLKKASDAKTKADLLSGITDRLKNKANPFAVAGDYDGAIKAIREDKEYKAHASELEELNNLLKEYERKRQLRL